MRKLAVSGLKWSFVQQFSTQIINYLSVIVLAALVEPAAQGIITIASIPIGFVGILGSFGIREKIIKEKENEINEKYKSCLFGFIVLSSCLLFVLSVLLTISVAWFYQDKYSFEIVFNYGLLTSLITPISVYNHYIVSFQSRDMNFKDISIINAVSTLIGILISIIVAYNGYGFLGLSFKLILPHFFNLILYLLVFKPSLKMTWCPTLYKDFKSFSTYLTLNNIANYFVRNIDYLIIGKVFNADILGQYSIAYKILLFPMKNVTSRIQSVSMPLLAKLNLESNEFMKKYFIIIGLLSFITLPMMGLIALTASDWVPLTFNYRYNLLIHMVMILSIVGAFQSLISPVGILYLLKDSTKLMFINSLVVSIIISSIFLLSSMTNNINIVLITYAFTWVVIVMPFSMYRIFKVYNMKLNKFYMTMHPSFFSVSISFVIVYVMRMYLFSFTPIINLIISGLLFLMFFLVLYGLIMKKGENSFFYYYNLLTGK